MRAFEFLPRGRLRRPELRRVHSEKEIWGTFELVFMLEKNYLRSVFFFLSI